MSPHIFATAWFTHAIQAGDIGGWMVIHEPDAIHEFPFGLTGAVRFIHLQEAMHSIAPMMGINPRQARSDC